MELYDIRGLLFDYGERFRLAIEEFRLGRGERLAVVGGNGSGKTTLLRILAFLERPRSCERFLYAGREAWRSEPARGGIGLLRQQPWIFRGSVAGNLAYGLQVRGIARGEIRRRVGAMCERLGLSRLEKAAARSLSGGEQKRLALGRVLISSPEVLLLDEPMAHLDRHSQEVIEEVLAASDSTLLFTTHDLRLASRLSRRTLALKEGRIARSLPENVFTGACGAGTLTTRRGLEIRLPHPVEGPTGTVMVSPGAIVLSLEPLRSSMRNVFPGRIESVEAEGENVRLAIDCGEVVAALISRRSYEDLGLNVHRAVFVSFKAASVEIL